jgi:hypothetical protein
MKLKDRVKKAINEGKVYAFSEFKRKVEKEDFPVESFDECIVYVDRINGKYPTYTIISEVSLNNKYLYMVDVFDNSFELMEVQVLFKDDKPIGIKVFNKIDEFDEESINKEKQVVEWILV